MSTTDAILAVLDAEGLLAEVPPAQEARIRDRLDRVLDADRVTTPAVRHPRT